MITNINGKIEEITPTYVVINTGGLGYMVNISLNTYTSIKDNKECKLFTHFIVREDAHSLYGFFDKNERKVFRALISVSGVGANTARMILSSLSTNEVYNAILNKNTSVFQTVKGIGAKSAQRIIVDLYDRLKKEDFEVQFSQGLNNTFKDEALSALIALGFSANVAEKALNKVLTNNEDIKSVEELIKQALNKL